MSHGPIVELVVGFTSGLRVDMPTDAVQYRRCQRAIAEQMAGPGRRVTIPERYTDPPRSTRVDDVVPRRSWDAASVGTTRLPVGLVRTAPLDEQPWPTGVLCDGATLGEQSLTLWADGCGVISYTWDLSDVCGTQPERLRSLTDAWLDAVEPVATTTIAEASRALEAASIAVGRRTERTDDTIAAVGRHRLFRIDGEPDADMLALAARHLVLLGKRSHFDDMCAEEERFCFAGNGASVELGRGILDSPSQLSPVLRYYEYWIAAMCSLDDELQDRYNELVARDVHAQPPRHLVGSDAHAVFFAHQDVLNAMSPQHAVSWRGYEQSWRLGELEAGVRDKVIAVEQASRAVGEHLANRTAHRTNLLVTFLTALTLVSIVTGVASFVLLESDLRWVVRTCLVAASVLAAILLFVVSVRPVIARHVRPPSPLTGEPFTG